MPAPPIPNINGGPAAASATSDAAQTVGGVSFTGGAQIGATGPAQNSYLITKAITQVAIVAVVGVSVGGLVWLFKKKGK